MKRELEILVKNFMRIALGTILYERRAFDPSCYSRVDLFDVPTYMLAYNTHPSANEIIDHLEKEIFQGALLPELKKVVLTISPKKDGEISEAYVFKISQGNLKAVSEIAMENEFSKTIDSLVKVCRDLEPLSESHYLHLAHSPGDLKKNQYYFIGKPLETTVGSIDVMELCISLTLKKKYKNSQVYASPSPSPEKFSESAINCICGTSARLDVFQCEECKKYSHLACYGFPNTTQLCFKCYFKFIPKYFADVVKFICAARVVISCVGQISCVKQISRLAEKEYAAPATMSAIAEKVSPKDQRMFEKVIKALQESGLLKNSQNFLSLKNGEVYAHWFKKDLFLPSVYTNKLSRTLYYKMLKSKVYEKSSNNENFIF